jgi:nucleoside-diphosphate-sugar epimerase
VDGTEIVWGDVAKGVDVVLHLAGRAHVMREAHADPLEEFRRVNCRATLALARTAAAAKVRRFVFVSSIGVNGSATDAVPFTEESVPAPTEPYAISKWEAEQSLRQLCAGADMECVIIRPPLVYGPDARGNFARLLRLVASGVPLPLGSVANLRSYIGVENLCSLLEVCLQHPAAADELFLAADGEDVSTTTLITEIARAMGRSARMFPCPIGLLRAAASVVRRSAEVQRLTSSLQVDGSYARRRLGWVPRVPLRAGIAAMAKAFVERHAHTR